MLKWSRRRRWRQMPRHACRRAGSSTSALKAMDSLLRRDAQAARSDQTTGNAMYPVGNLRHGQRAANVVALDRVTPQCAQVVPRGLVLDALSYDTQPKVVTQVDG